MSTVETIAFGVAALACIIAAVLWSRSAVHRRRVWQQLQRQGTDHKAVLLALSDFRKDGHTALLYVLLVGIVGVLWAGLSVAWIAVLVVPAVLTMAIGWEFVADARLSQQRLELEGKALEVIDQADTAPKRWAARLAPDDLPHIEGFEVGRVYEAGTGLMAGDFYDWFRVAPSRVAAVIGDVTGHGIEPSITAFQAKYLLRSFLKQFRDPAQALEELNVQMSASRGEEFISLCVLVFDTEAQTLRYASAGHPPAWLWHGREVTPLHSTGPLLKMLPDGTYFSREISLEEGDMAVMYTDGLAEARSGGVLFGEDRIGATVRRDPGASPTSLVQGLLEAARDFSDGPIEDDVAILAIRWS